MAEPTTAFFDAVAKIVATVVSPRMAVTVFLVTGTLLTVPLVSSATFPWLDSFVSDQKVWVAIGCLTSGVFSGTYLVQHGWTAVKATRLKRRRQRRLKERLHTLSVAEKHVLQEHLENERVLRWSANRTVILSLLTDGILRIIARPQIGALVDLTVVDEAWAYLGTHKDLVDTPGNPRSERGNSEWMI